MTEKLRYIGPTSPEFKTGEVYTVLVALHQNMYWIRLAGQSEHPYQTLAQLLKFWQPAGAPYQDSGLAERGDAGMN